MTGGQFFDQFIEDYFAECDQHLTAIKRVLLALEEHNEAAADGNALQQLFRSLHTIKGLSGMVGLASAERVAHAIEDGLRIARGPDASIDPDLIEVLFEGAGLLERCIAARRLGTEPPDVDAYVRQVGASSASSQHYVPGRGADAAKLTVEALAAPSAERDSVIETVVFEFAPSTELAQRGVGVDAVRARLASLGELLQAKPRVADGGGIVFEFVLALRPGAVPSEAWRADGLTWTPRASSSAGSSTDSAQNVAHGRATPGSDSLTNALFGSNMVRADLARLDDLMRLVGELVGSRARLDDALRQATAGGGAAWDSLHETNEAMERQLRSLREGVMRIRLVPVGEVFERMRFAVREVARETGKRAQLKLQGENTEIDKLVVERMLEPLLHLVRNAVSHGIELPEERRARGKSPDGSLSLRAAASGDRVVIEVEDDGAGIDVEAVIARARSRGLLTSEDGAADTLLEALCAPGLSTRDEADLASGRGVGMGVVRSTVRALGGELTLQTTPGRGTRFTIELPLTLMIVDALLIEVGGQRMAVPQPVLREVLEIDAKELTRFEKNEVIAYRGRTLPLLSLRRLFGHPESTRPALYVLVVGTETSPAGLVVDRLVGLREIVAQPLADPLVAVPGISGATELGDGHVSLILDAAALVRLARERRDRRSEPQSGAGTSAGMPRVA